MGFWTWAELSIGIIVGCLPALPKFLQHVGPKIYGRAIGNEPGFESRSGTSKPKVNPLARAKRSLSKYGVGSSVSKSCDDPYNSRSVFNDEYLVLDGGDASPPRVPILHPTTGWPGQGIATARDDLEHR